MLNTEIVFAPTKTEVSSFVGESDGVVWFHAGHMGEILEYTNAYRYLPTVLMDSEYREVSIGVGRPSLYVREEAVYKLIMKSKSRYADEFCHWLAYDVLPSLRRTGIYSAKTEDCERFEAVGLRSKLRQAQLDLVERLGKIAREGSVEELEPAIKSIDLTRNMLNELLRSEPAEADSGKVEQGLCFSPAPKQTRSLEEAVLETAKRMKRPIAARDVQMRFNAKQGRPDAKQVRNCFQLLAKQGKGTVSGTSLVRMKFSIL